jgi:hypothetical protein
MINSLIDIEESYVNINHPSFNVMNVLADIVHEDEERKARNNPQGQGPPGGTGFSTQQNRGGQQQQGGSKDQTQLNTLMMLTGEGSEHVKVYLFQNVSKM